MTVATLNEVTAVKIPGRALAHRMDAKKIIYFYFPTSQVLKTSKDLELPPLLPNIGISVKELTKFSELEFCKLFHQLSKTL